MIIRCITFKHSSIFHIGWNLPHKIWKEGETGGELPSTYTRKILPVLYQWVNVGNRYTVWIQALVWWAKVNQHPQWYLHILESPIRYISFQWLVFFSALNKVHSLLFMVGICTVVLPSACDLWSFQFFFFHMLSLFAFKGWVAKKSKW
jgi:hypothetical protein